MSIITWIASLFGRDVTNKEEASLFYELAGEASYRQLALIAAENIIGNALSKCEFKFYENGKETKGLEWYRWNVEPNKNETSSRFMQKIVRQLCEKGECLVVELSGQLLIADSFMREPKATTDDIFTQVTIGDMTSHKTFYQSDVLYWRLGDGKISQVLGALGASYSKLLAYGMNSYQHSRGTKAIFSYDAIPAHVAKEDSNAWIQGQVEKYGKFVAADNGIVTVGKGTGLTAFGRSTTYSQESTRDIRAMVGDILDFTALAFGIPPAVLRGDVEGTKDAVDNLLTFCIDPWADMIREEIVRKQIGRERHLEGMDVIVDTRQIKHIDVLSVATSVDKLISSGVFCVNDIRKLCGEPIIDEPWAWEHFMTKNYTDIENLESLEGGE